mmetsp:Transcript_19119/g.36831  ORF Transcript_19119/g.36831 Transcript_19119/m.36831 type:complete len:213 (-) Transcript_19119:25-663(-)
MASIHENLRLNNGHKSIVLANGSVTRKGVGGFLDSVSGRSLAWEDLDHSTPLSESSANFVILLAAKVEVSQPLSVKLAIGSRKRAGAFVNLNAEDDTLLLETINKVGSVWHLLEERFLEKDDSADVLSKSGGGGKQVTVSAAVFTVVFNTDALEALANRSDRFVSGKNSFTRCGDGIRGGNKLLGIFPFLGENVAADSLKALLGGLGVSHVP